MGMIKRLVSFMVMAMTAVTSVMASGNDPQTGTGRDPVGIVAHRGYWNCEEGGYARNSFAAFKAAAQAGFWGTEFDINMTADGQFLVFHDEVIDGRRIDQTDYSALKDYRLENGRLFFSADSDAIITKGIISLLIRVYDGRTPAEILASDFSFIDRIGLKEHLSPTRANGLVSMMARIMTIAKENA